MTLGTERGQHTAEMVLLFGVTALVAISMQLVVRRSIHSGVQHVSDVVLGPPPPEEPDPGQLTQELQVNSQQTVTEQGSEGFQRTTTTQESLRGHSVNEDERFRTIPQ